MDDEVRMINLNLTISQAVVLLHMPASYDRSEITAAWRSRMMRSNLEGSGSNPPTPKVLGCYQIAAYSVSHEMVPAQ